MTTPAQEAKEFAAANGFAIVPIGRRYAIVWEAEDGITQKIDEVGGYPAALNAMKRHLEALNTSRNTCPCAPEGDGSNTKCPDPVTNALIKAPDESDADFLRRIENTFVPIYGLPVTNVLLGPKERAVLKAHEQGTYDKFAGIDVAESNKVMHHLQAQVYGASAKLLQPTAGHYIIRPGVLPEGPFNSHHAAIKRVRQLFCQDADIRHQHVTVEYRK